MQALNRAPRSETLLPLCEAEAVSVRYDQKLANDRVSLTVKSGEVVALLGDNGAGKSTLLHALYGLVKPIAGVIRYRGQTVLPTPERAIAAGLGLIHQHFLLVPTLTVAENIVLGQEPRRFGVLVDQKRAAQQVEELGLRHGMAVSPNRLVSELSVGEAQRVEILKALYRGAQLLLLDEPTAVLTPGEASRLLATLRGLLNEGVHSDRALLIVTHKLDEVLQIADRAVVMRTGRVVEEFQRCDFSATAIARAMVGREVHAVSRVARSEVDATIHGASAPALRVQDLVVEREGSQWVRRVSLEVPSGRIVGIAGVAGNGQSELVAAIAGLLPAQAGRICLGSADITREDVRSRSSRGLAVVPEDRQRHGLVLDMTLAENLLLGHEARLSYGPGQWLLDLSRIRAMASSVLEKAEVRPAEPDAQARALSGGNQQKVVLARALAVAQELPKVLVAAQPTRGVDIGAIESIHRTLLDARDAGCAILLVSAELSELQSLCDRILVMYRGQIVASLDNDPQSPVSREQLGELMAGVGTTVEG